MDTKIFKTDDGHEMLYDTYYWAVYFKNHSVFIGTDKEMELFRPIKIRIHFGASFNTYGFKIFKHNENAVKWIEENKPKCN